MGQLIEGDPLPHDKMREVLAYIRLHGALQFLNIWKRMKGIENDELKFGDEIECGIFEVDAEKKTVKLSCRGADINYQLNGLEEVYSHESEGCNWHAEFGAWMVESTPSRPYSHFANEMLRIERNMVVRRRRLLSALKENEIAPTVTSFPLMGVGDFIANAKPFASPHSESIYVPDYVINPHPRFATLVRNIRERRGKKVDIRVPLYRDTNTPEFSVTGGKDYSFPTGYSLEEGHEIHMDCMAFGMGMCCLQVTFQAKDVDESRYMYDQLAVLAPIMLALTAATPIFKGRLADIDARWTVISQSVDDRRDAEKGLLSEEDRLKASDPQLAGNGIRLIPKSRYDSISTFIYHCEGDSLCQRTFEEYNDLSCPIDENVYQLLKDQGVDENLAHHVAHLFIRDAIVAFSGKIELNDEETTDHFECIQSTNWQSCRWKPPPFQHTIDHSTSKEDNNNNNEGEGREEGRKEDHHIGWRSEFRSMEVQFTDFENAAFTVFILLITRVMLAFDLGFYIPISKVDENMKRAHYRNAVLTQKFFFRKHIAPPAINLGSIDEVDHPNNSNKSLKFCCDGKDILENGSSKTDSEYEEMTMTEIFLGKENYYPGLLPLVYAYLDFINCDTVTSQRVHEYLHFIEKRVTGELVTPATYIRRFVVSHPDYKNDSVVSPSIAHDLLVACQQIGDGSRLCPELLGDIRIPKIRKEDAYGKVLAGKLSSQDRSQLIQTLIERAKIPRSSKVPRGRLRGSSDLTSSTTASKPGSPKRGGRDRGEVQG